MSLVILLTKAWRQIPAAQRPAAPFTIHSRAGSTIWIRPHCWALAGLFLPPLSPSLQIDVVMKPGWLAKLSPSSTSPSSASSPPPPASSPLLLLPVSFPSQFSKAPGLSMTGHPLLLLLFLLSFFTGSAQTLSSPPFARSQTFK